MADVQDVAKYLLQLADASDEDPVSNLKLQKMLYYCQGFCLAILDRPLFSAPIEKWTHGPVCPTVYHGYKTFGSNPIPAPDDFDSDGKLEEEEKNLIQQVYSTYGQFAAWRLREMTHEEQPWLSAQPSGVISNDSMREFFKTRIVA